METAASEEPAANMQFGGTAAARFRSEAITMCATTVCCLGLRQIALLIFCKCRAVQASVAKPAGEKQAAGLEPAALRKLVASVQPAASMVP